LTDVLLCNLQDSFYATVTTWRQRSDRDLSWNNVMNRSALTGWLSGANASPSAGDRSVRSAPSPAAKPVAASPAAASVGRPGARLAVSLTIRLTPRSAGRAAPVGVGPAGQAGRRTPG
jgi:hypothetical protein